MKKKFSLQSLTIATILIFNFLLPANLLAINIEKLEPSSWWIGFENPTVQLLVYGKDISTTRPHINYDGVEIKNIILTENPNYLFLDLNISDNTKAGDIKIEFKKGKKTVTSYNWMLNKREENSALREGFNSSDAMYLIMPDRFANGDPNNDTVKGMKEKADRDEPYGRHGGDIKGIADNLDYITDLGFTALWINPVLENDQPETSYHGYAITDFYNIDRRFGSNEDFKKLV